MPSNRTWASAVEYNSKIYLIGGLNTPSLVEECNPFDDAWTTKVPLPKGRHAVSAVVLQGKIYAIGGGSAVPNYNDLQMYDPVTNVWVAKTGMPTARDSTASVVRDGKIYVLGGLPYSELDGTTKVEIYDSATDSWIAGPDMLIKRWEFGAVVIHGTIYAIGGRELPGKNSKTNEKLTLIQKEEPFISSAELKESTVALTWTQVRDADSYIIKRSIAAGGPYTTIESGYTVQRTRIMECRAVKPIITPLPL